MYDKLIDVLKRRPTAYSPNDYAFWDDEHISGHMLEAHLNPKVDAATRTPAYVQASVDWIAGLAKPGGDLLDLGCGPGIYAERFDDAGLRVTGIDLSRRSIAYAEQSAARQGRQIAYTVGNYLSIAYEEAFDVVTLIYCDFCVLAPSYRNRLLKKVYRALRPGGIFIVDAWTPNIYQDFKEQRTVKVENGGFWSPEPYVCIKCDYQYAPSVMLEQYHVVTNEEMRTYNIWNESIDAEGLARVLHAAGFSDVSFYADVCGNTPTPQDKTICAVSVK